MRHTRFITPIVASAALVLLTATPALAADTGTSFTLTGGLLSITAPADATSFGTAATGTTSFGGPLGTVTVTDARGALLGAWTTAATSTAFTNATVPTANAIANSAVTYAPGLGSLPSGLGVFTPGPGGAMGTSQTAFSKATGAGNNAVSWNPTISVAVPAAAVAGVYNAVITHSVA